MMYFTKALLGHKNLALVQKKRQQNDHFIQLKVHLSCPGRNLVSTRLDPIDKTFTALKISFQRHLKHPILLPPPCLCLESGSWIHTVDLHPLGIGPVWLYHRPLGFRRHPASLHGGPGPTKADQMPSVSAISFQIHFIPFTFILITSQFFRLMAVFWRFPDLMSPPPPRPLTLQIFGEPNVPKVSHGSVRIKHPNLTSLDVIILPVGGRINFMLADFFDRFSPTLTPMPEPQYWLEIGPYIGQYGRRAPHNSNNQMESLDITFSLWEEPVEKPILPIKNWWAGALRCPPPLPLLHLFLWHFPMDMALKIHVLMQAKNWCSYIQKCSPSP